MNAAALLRSIRLPGTLQTTLLLNLYTTCLQATPHCVIGLPILGIGYEPKALKVSYIVTCFSMLKNAEKKPCRKQPAARQQPKSAPHGRSILHASHQQRPKEGKRKARMRPTPPLYSPYLVLVRISAGESTALPCQCFCAFYSIPWPVACNLVETLNYRLLPEKLITNGSAR